MKTKAQSQAPDHDAAARRFPLAPFIVAEVLSPERSSPRRSSGCQTQQGRALASGEARGSWLRAEAASSVKGRPPSPVGGGPGSVPIDETPAGCTPRFATRTPSRSRAARRTGEPRTPPTSTAKCWRSWAATRHSRRRRLTPPSARRARITSFILPRSPSPPSAPSSSSARSDHVQLACWAPVATTRDAAARRDLHRVGRLRDAGSSGRWTGVARTGDETPLISRTTSKRPQTPDNKVSRRRSTNPMFSRDFAAIRGFRTHD